MTMGLQRLGPTTSIRSALASSAGFTVVEVLVASMILLVGMGGTMSMITGANKRTLNDRARQGGTALAREVTEASRSVPYPQITPTGLEGVLQARPGLEDSGAAAGWEIRRRGFTYLVETSSCSVDDPKDSSGSHDLGSYCAGSASGSTDRNPDDYKVVTVDVSWAGTSGHGRVHQQAMVNNPGNAVGPAVTSLALTVGSNNVITSVLGNVGLTIGTSSPPASVTWSVDGVVQGSGTGGGTLFSMLWPISGLFDGTYLVDARAYDADGRSGPSRALTVTLNRYVPLPPSGVASGRNGSVVELEWLANQERDIVGYRVYRHTLLGRTQVCSVTVATDCQDTNPPASPILVYDAVALDYDPSGNQREGTPSVNVSVTLLNNRPNPPTGLTATSVDGATLLSWAAPLPDDPDLGDSISFYRIYRDGTAVDARYDRTGAGTDLTYTDGRTGGTQHTYRITAVDTQLAESTLLGPVTM